MILILPVFSSVRWRGKVGGTTFPNPLPQGEADESGGEIGTDEFMDKKTFRIPVSNGIFEHYRRMGNAIWLFLWFIDKTTKETIDERGRRLGQVLGGVPISDSDPAESLGCSAHVIRKYRRALVAEKYIEQKRTPFGHIIAVLNSKKWFTEERYKHTAPEKGERHEPAIQSGTNVPSELQVRTETKKTLQDSTVDKARKKDTAMLTYFAFTGKFWDAIGLYRLPEACRGFVAYVEQNPPRPDEKLRAFLNRTEAAYAHKFVPLKTPKAFEAAILKTIEAKGDVVFNPRPPLDWKTEVHLKNLLLQSLDKSEREVVTNLLKRVQAREKLTDDDVRAWRKVALRVYPPKPSTDSVAAGKV